METQTEALDQEGEQLRNELNTCDVAKSSGTKGSLKDFDAFCSKGNMIKSIDAKSNLIQDGGQLRPIGATSVKNLTPSVNYLKI